MPEFLTEYVETLKERHKAQSAYFCSFSCQFDDSVSTSAGKLHACYSHLFFTTAHEHDTGSHALWVVPLEAVHHISRGRSSLFTSSSVTNIEMQIDRVSGGARVKQKVTLSEFHSEQDYQCCYRLLQFLARRVRGKSEDADNKLWLGFKRITSTRPQYDWDHVRQTPVRLLLSALIYPKEHQELYSHFDLPIISAVQASQSKVTFLEGILWAGECTIAMDASGEVHGTLYVSQNYVCFRSEVSMVAKMLKNTAAKLSFRLRTILEVSKHIVPPFIEVLSLKTKKGVFQFRYMDDFAEAFSSIETAWYNALQTGVDFETQQTLTVDQCRKLHAQHQAIGTEAPGNVSKKEFAAALFPFSCPSLGESLFDAFDVDQNGLVSLADFIHAMRVLLVGTVRDKLGFFFHVSDTKKNNIIDLEEFRNTFLAIVSDSDSGSDIVGELFKAFDAQGRGYITMEDCVVAITKNGFVKGALTNLGITTASNVSLGAKSFVAFGDESWQVMITLLQGIKEAMTQVLEQSMDGPIATTSTVSMTDSVRGERHPQKTVLLPGWKGASTSTLVEYYPNVFERIRTNFGTDQNQYMHSLGLDLLIANIRFGSLITPRELSSSGKSGSFFFLSPDSQLVIKSLPLVEAKTLLSILPSYCEYVCDNPETLLVLFYGLYQLILDGKQTFFLVMTNVFPPGAPICEVYDLKGSTAGRTTAPEQRKGPLTALKDLDLDRDIILQPQNGIRAKILTQILKDSTFLRNCNLIDYSLLMGIATNGDEPDPSSRVYLRGLPTADGANRIHFGIIDVLTPFNTSRVAESAIKGVIQTNASCIPPGPYQTRFVDFLTTTIHDPNSIQEAKSTGSPRLTPQHLVRHGIATAARYCSGLGTTRLPDRAFSGIETLPMDLEDLPEATVLVHAPYVFTKLQVAYGEGPEAYMDSWKQPLVALSNEAQSADASEDTQQLGGKPLFQSGDRKFVITLLTSAELVTLKSTLPRWYDHVFDNLTDHALSFITRIYGIYSVHGLDNDTEHYAVLEAACGTGNARVYQIGTEQWSQPLIGIPSQVKDHILNILKSDLELLIEYGLNQYKVMLLDYDAASSTPVADQSKLECLRGPFLSTNKKHYIRVRIVDSFMKYPISDGGEIQQNPDKEQLGFEAIYSPAEYAKRVEASLKEAVANMDEETHQEEPYIMDINTATIDSGKRSKEDAQMAALIRGWHAKDYKGFDVDTFKDRVRDILG